MKMPNLYNIPRSDDDRLLRVLQMRDEGRTWADICATVGSEPDILRSKVSRIRRDYAASECA